MSEELGSKLRWALEEGWNKGNLDAWNEVYAADYVHHRPPFEDFESLEAEKQYVADTRSAFTEPQFTIHEMIAEGNTTVARWTWQAKHTGQSPTLPFPPTGKQVTLVGCLVSRWEGNKIVEEWQYSDYLGFLQQLGVIPPLG